MCKVYILVWFCFVKIKSIYIQDKITTRIVFFISLTFFSVAHACSIKAKGDYILGFMISCVENICCSFGLAAIEFSPTFRCIAWECERERNCTVHCAQAQAIINSEKKEEPIINQSVNRLALFHNRLISLILSACACKVQS